MSNPKPLGRLAPPALPQDDLGVAEEPAAGGQLERRRGPAEQLAVRHDRLRHDVLRAICSNARSHVWRTD